MYWESVALLCCLLIRGCEMQLPPEKNGERKENQIICLGNFTEQESQEFLKTMKARYDAPAEVDTLESAVDIFCDMSKENRSHALRAFILVFLEMHGAFCPSEENQAVCDRLDGSIFDLCETADCAPSEKCQDSRCIVMTGCRADSSCDIVEICENSACIAGCRTDSGCPVDKACINGRCVDPCSDQETCGRNALCRPKEHRSVCTCRPGFEGNPNDHCRKIPNQ